MLLSHTYGISKINLHINVTRIVFITINYKRAVFVHQPHATPPLWRLFIFLHLIFTITVVIILLSPPLSLSLPVNLEVNLCWHRSFVGCQGSEGSFCVPVCSIYFWAKLKPPTNQLTIRPEHSGKLHVPHPHPVRVTLTLYGHAFISASVSWYLPLRTVIKYCAGVI